MDQYLYSPEKSVQVIVSLLKQYGINYVIASPGATNVSLVASLQSDPFFKLFSGPDERSAAYMACGMAEETGMPVVITCTGATSSRNYMPGLTEAYYRKLPVLAITASQNYAYSGHMHPQFMDRTIQPRDLVLKSVQLPIVKGSKDLWECKMKVNDAIQELTRRGGGPVHINYITQYPSKGEYSNKLCDVSKVIRYTKKDLSEFSIPNVRIAIFVGSHRGFTKEETKAIDAFCATYDAVVFCDHTSNFKGKYRVFYPGLATQEIDDDNLKLDILIHIGEISGDYYTTGKLKSAKTVWRVSPDGEMRDYFKKLSAVFEMEEFEFFDFFANKGSSEEAPHCNYLESCLRIIDNYSQKILEAPFSNIWAASQLAKILPKNSVLHLGILNSLRSWNFFDVDPSINIYSNVGGFGIDGGVSTMMGASFIHPEKLYFGVFGDLAFFYDMNCLGNRDVRNNVRILLVNNGKGTEFRNYTHSAYQFGEDADEFVAAARHYGNKSRSLVKHYAEDLGYEYHYANNKEEFAASLERFVAPKQTEKPMIFEIFTDSTDESDALKMARSLMRDTSSLKNRAIKTVKNEIVSLIGKDKIKKILKK